nr:hypothetical protein [Tanacetum cinerariifolium]
MSRVKCYNCKKEGHFAKDSKKAKVKDYEYYKTKMLLLKKDKDEQVLLAEDQAWLESSSDSDLEMNANMVFMAQIEKVLSDSEASSSSDDEKISEVSYYLSESESEYEYENSEYYDNTTNYEKRVQKIDRLTRSLLIQGLPNDIYSVIDSNKTAKDLWDALARHMLGSEYGLVIKRKHEDESKSESRSVLLESSWKPRELNRNMKLQTDQQCKNAMNVKAAT